MIEMIMNRDESGVLTGSQVEISCPKDSLSGIYNCLNLRRGVA